MRISCKKVRTSAALELDDFFRKTEPETSAYKEWELEVPTDATDTVAAVTFSVTTPTHCIPDFSAHYVYSVVCWSVF